LDQPDVFEGESLRDLGRRTWNALLNSSGFGVIKLGGKWIDGEWVEGFDVCFPLFDPNKQHFQVPFDLTRYPQGPFEERIYGAAKPDWFDAHWVAPKDCTGDEIISIEDLPGLPPIKATKRPAA
jgi:hypothetical protein